MSVFGRLKTTATAVVFALALAGRANAAELQSLVDRIAAQAPFARAQLGVSVVEVQTGRSLASRQAGVEFAPASNFKLLVAATALAYLGPNFHMTTQLLARGALAGSELQGDLILVGGGDPVLSRRDLQAAVAAVKAAGIARVSGAVLADGALFDRQRYGAGWALDDAPFYYQVPIEALAVDEGTEQITASAGARAGDPVTLAVVPDGGYMTIVSSAVTVALGGPDDVDCFRSPGSRAIQIIGHMPIGAQPEKLPCAVEDNLDYAASVFKQLLRDNGVVVDEAAPGSAPPNSPLDIEDNAPDPRALGQRYPSSSVIWVHQSPPLAELLRRMLPPSDNFIADELMKMLPVAAFKQRGTFDGGLKVEEQFLRGLGRDPATIDGGDGSGLSQGDRITPSDLTSILRWEASHPAGAPFVAALARVGIDGTLKHRMAGSDAVGRVRAKDGYIWHVSTLSGYAQTKHHGLVAFSIMFNGALGPIKPFKDAEDRIVEALVDM